ncbi:MAG: acyl carrier protein [Lachnospiraceae bacterium]|nr:acyl carrier protein [Lachnospiraceae bacterium]
MEFEELRKILVQILGVYPDEVTPESTFEGDLGADSLDMYQVLLQMEETFEIEVVPEQLRDIKTVAEAVEYIKAKKK